MTDRSLNVKYPEEVEFNMKKGNIVFAEIMPKVRVKFRISQIEGDNVKGFTIDHDYDAEEINIEKKQLSPILIDESNLKLIEFVKKDVSELNITNNSGFVIFEKKDYLIGSNLSSLYALYLIPYNGYVELNCYSDRIVYLHELQNHYDSYREYKGSYK
ncbi:hypothetical protein SAMN05421769_1999 [Chryseobacterium scophthalmum]|uniref:Uncharacterized protein n=2 Tax=Chryseobacterium scophthalmum TaxID=59733 RepID=A0A1N6GAQ9_9FLAO|nr:hypothetical protein SAMN05421769_1999 [Chryseobacterium scophthalmum]